MNCGNTNAVSLQKCIIFKPTNMLISDRIKLVSIDEYCERIDPLLFRLKKKSPYKKISRQTVYYRIANNKPLPEVLNVIKNANVYFLTVKADF
jgi:hypothetical protein